MLIIDSIESASKYFAITLSVNLHLLKGILTVLTVYVWTDLTHHLMDVTKLSSVNMSAYMQVN